MLLLQGARLPSLVEELRSHMPCGAAKKKKRKETGILSVNTSGFKFFHRENFPYTRVSLIPNQHHSYCPRFEWTHFFNVRYLFHCIYSTRLCLPNLERLNWKQNKGGGYHVEHRDMNSNKHTHACMHINAHVCAHAQVLECRHPAPWRECLLSLETLLHLRDRAKLVVDQERPSLDTALLAMKSCSPRWGKCILWPL